MKTEVLWMLRNIGSYLSGQQLCEMLGVSRAAVQRVIGGLKEEGCVIETVQNRGYRLVEGTDVITQAELAPMFHAQWTGTKLTYPDEMDFTNIRARKLAEEGVLHETLVVADRQTTGKGWRGRSWVSPAGAGIWMSMVLRPPMSLMNTPMLTPITGLTVAGGVKGNTELEVMTRWPNDAALNGRGICGTPTEMSTEMECIRYVIPGIRINVNMDGFSEEIKAITTSLKLEAGRSIKRSLIITAAADSFEYYYGTLMKTCSMSGLRDSCNESLVNPGREVLVLDPRGQYKGGVLGIDDRGSLLVRQEDGNVLAVVSGEVSVRGIYGYV